MAVRREKQTKLPDHPYSINARTEIYTCAEEVASDCKNRAVRHKDYDLSHKEFRKEWRGVSSYAEALDLLANGYQPVVETLREELRCAGNGTNPRFKFSNEVAGFLPIVPLALKGVPNSMIDMRIRPIKMKVLDIYYDMTARSSTDPDEFIKAGKVLLSAILALEQQGYKFNLYGIQSYWDTNNYDNHALDVLCVKIKSSNSPIDLKRMSFPLTHPAFFRVIGFDWQGKSPITRYIGDGRGCALSYDFTPEECNTIAQELFGNNALYLSCSRLIDNNYTTETLKEVLVGAKPK